MEVHLVDGTYELFRHFFALPSRLDDEGREVGALVGVLESVLYMLRDGATHVGVATDHVVESFRNDLYDGYKTGEGLEPILWNQFHPLEEALAAMGVVVWPMVDHEADDGLASAAAICADDPEVTRIYICTADKDLAQCVRGDRIVQFDRRRRVVRDTAGVVEKFGVPPESIPDYLALVGDSADGFPGVPRWGARSAATVLAHYGSIEAIPPDPSVWGVSVRGAAGLAASLQDHLEDAHLFKHLATLVEDAVELDSVDALRYRGPTPAFASICERLGVPSLAARAAEAAPS